MDPPFDYACISCPSKDHRANELYSAVDENHDDNNGNSDDNDMATSAHQWALAASPAAEDPSWRWGPPGERWPCANPVIYGGGDPEALGIPRGGGILSPEERGEMVRKLMPPPISEDGFTYIQGTDWHGEVAGPQGQFHDLGELYECVWQKFGSLWSTFCERIVRFNPNP